MKFTLFKVCGAVYTCIIIFVFLLNKVCAWFPQKKKKNNKPIQKELARDIYITYELCMVSTMILYRVQTLYGINDPVTSA